jgi:hypothetical protein
MSLQAGGAPAILQRDLGTPAAIQGAQAFGSAIYGPQLAAPLSGVVFMLAQDGAANFPLTAGGPTYTLLAAGAAYTYSGNNASLVYSGSGAPTYTILADGATYSYSGNNANLIYNRILLADGISYIYSGNDATLVYSGGPPPVIEVIGVCGPQVTNVFLFNGVVEPPFPVQRRTS